MLTHGGRRAAPTASTGIYLSSVSRTTVHADRTVSTEGMVMVATAYTSSLIDSAYCSIMHKRPNHIFFYFYLS